MLSFDTAHRICAVQSQRDGDSAAGIGSVIPAPTGPQVIGKGLLEDASDNIKYKPEVIEAAVDPNKGNYRWQKMSISPDSSCRASTAVA